MTPEQIKVLHDVQRTKETDGWKHLVRDFSAKVDLLQEQINQIGGNEVQYSENDLRKIEMRLIREIIGYEEALARSMTARDVGDDLASF